jgi:hypothetical protein
MPNASFDSLRFMALDGHLNFYQVNTHRPVYDMLSHFPVAFRDKRMVS